MKNKYPLIKYLLAISSPVIWLLNWLFPTKKDLILFQAANYDAYSDNVKYLFEYMALNSDKKCYWLTRNRNLEEYLTENKLKFVHHPSLKSIYYFLRCNYMVSGETSPPNGKGFLSHYAKKISVSHGYGPRSTNSPDGKVYKTAFSIAKSINKFDIMGFSSLFTKNLIGKGLFLLPESKTIVTGLPRCDILFDDKLCDLRKNKKDFCKGEFLDINDQSKVILYAPTWRQNSNIGLPLLNDGALGLSTFNSTLKNNNIFLLISCHILDSDKLIMSELSNIKLFIPTFNVDIHNLLPEIDLLISDYSSVITDFLLLKRPIIFHIPDYEYYNNYGLNVDFKSFLPGKEIMNLIDLQNLIIHKTVFTISKKNESDIYLKMFYDTEIKKSCQRYLQYFNNSFCVE